MEGLNGIYDLYKYNIMYQKFSQGEYKELFIICCVFFIFSFYYKIYISTQFLFVLYLRIKNGYFFKFKSQLFLDGQYVTKHTNYTVKIKTLMSDNFRAMWEHILKSKNENIYNLSECYNESSDDFDESISKSDDLIFIVEQQLPFEIDKDIYCAVEIFNGQPDENERNSNSNNNIRVHTKKFTLIIFSLKYDAQYLKNYVKNIKNNYLKTIEDKRKYLRFHYKLKKIEKEENDICWYEKEFHTNKTFDKLYIKNKDEILSKINFFIKNKEWYIKEGHPYTLGIGLYGPPGTGKTSFIKSLAKMTNRHIVEISLSKINSENDLFDVFYDNKYHKYNKEPIEFKDKIIIFEDIDCASDIVLKREHKSSNNLSEMQNLMNTLLNSDNDDNNMFSENKKSTFKKSTIPINISEKNDSLKLSSLLNIMDGISEDDGRILIMTSNRWDKLDDALIRPGRIDIEIELGYIDEEILNDYTQHCYKKNFPKNRLKSINFENITPCIMINEHTNSNNFNDYINKLSNY